MPFPQVLPRIFDVHPQKIGEDDSIWPAHLVMGDSLWKTWIPCWPRGKRHRDRKRCNPLRYRVVSLALCISPDLLPPNYYNGALLIHQPKTKIQQQSHISWTSSWVFSRLPFFPAKKKMATNNKHRILHPTTPSKQYCLLGLKMRQWCFTKKNLIWRWRTWGPMGCPFSVGFFFVVAELGCRGKQKDVAHSFRQKDFGGRFFWMLVLCDLDLF